MTDEASWMRTAFVISAVIGAVLAMLVMKMAKNKDDPPWLRESRRIAFFVASQCLLLSAAYILSGGEISLRVIMLIAVILIGSCDALLALNVLSLYFRSPPHGGVKVRPIPPDEFGYYLAMALVDIERLDRGQHLTHAFLQAIRNNQDMRPDKVIVEDPNVIYSEKFQPRKQ